MNGNVRVQSIVDHYPDVESVFSMYDVELTDDIIGLTIEGLCDAYDIDIEDLILDLEEAVADSKNAEWLSAGGEDEWTEGFTEEKDKTETEDIGDGGGYDDSDEEFDGDSF